MRTRAVLLLLTLCGAGFSQTPSAHWVETWTASQQAPRTPGATPFNNQTVRMILHTTVGGPRLRLEFANTYSPTALEIGSAHVALRHSEAAIEPATDRPLSVNGQRSFTIPPGAVVFTDPVDLNLPPAADLAVSVFVPHAAAPVTQHSLGLHTTYISKEGDFTSALTIAAPTTSLIWYWVSSVQVMAPANTATAIAFGDSITDGYHSTPDTNRMWPAVLAQRLLPQGQVAVVNEAISGNQVLHDGGLGVNALARFDHDVIARAGVKWLIILEGINDIGRGLGPNASPAALVTADDQVVRSATTSMIGGHRQMIERAHAHGIKVIGATLTPYEGAAYYSEKGDVVRAAVNTWIRTSHAYDAVIDFDALTRDPAHPARFKPDFDSGDHLHPNDTGYKAMADSIDLGLFK